MKGTTTGQAKESRWHPTGKWTRTEPPRTNLELMILPVALVVAASGAWATFNWALSDNPAAMGCVSAGIMMLLYIIAYALDPARKEEERREHQAATMATFRVSLAASEATYRKSRHCSHCQTVIGLESIVDRG